MVRVISAMGGFVSELNLHRVIVVIGSTEEMKLHPPGRSNTFTSLRKISQLVSGRQRDTV